MMSTTLTHCCTVIEKYIASDDQKRIEELARTEPATASSHFFCSTLSPATALTVSMPTIDSTRIVCRLVLVSWAALTERASGTWMSSVATSTTGTAMSGTSASSPTII